MNTSYVYLLIDPRNGLPFYVGKGRGRRCFSHLLEARTTNKNSYKLQKIRKIERLGMEVVIRKIEENISDEDAQEFERFVIEESRAIGIDLTNMTDGGDGASGYKHRSESLKKISDANKGKIVSDETKHKLSLYVKSNNPMKRKDVIEKMSGESHWAYGKPAKNKGSKWTDEQRKAQSDRFSGEKHNMFGKPCSDTRREAIRKATTGVKKSTTINMRKPKRKEQCPHCGLFASGGNLARWHNDNCKENNNVAASK